MSWCPTCGCSPCPNPAFCRLCREADRRIAAERRETPPHDEPRAAQSTCDALFHELRAYGVGRLAELRCRQRLAGLSSHQVRELLAALMRARPHPNIGDELLLLLGEQLP